MKKQILSSLLVLGMIASQTPAVSAKSRTVNVLTKISYDANYAYQGKASTSYSYNKKGLVSAQQRQWPKSLFNGKSYYTYNKQNKIVKETGTNIQYGESKNKYKIDNHDFVYKNGLLVSGKGDQPIYRKGRLVGFKNELKTKFYYNKKGQLDHITNFSAFDTQPRYSYDRYGYLIAVKDSALSDQVNYKNQYRNGLLVRQTYQYKNHPQYGEKAKTKKGTITYQYKKVKISSALYNHVRNQQKSLYYIGDLDYYGIGFTNWFFFNA